MIQELAKSGIISKRKIFLTHYKELGLNDNQALLVILMMMLSVEQKFVSPTVLADHMTLSIEEIEDNINELMEKGYITLKGKKMDFSNLFNQIFLLAESKLIHIGNEKVISQLSNQLNLIFTKQQTAELDDILNTKMSKAKLLNIIINNPKIASYDKLILEIAKVLKESTKSINNINWLSDSE